MKFKKNFFIFLHVLMVSSIAYADSNMNTSKDVLASFPKPNEGITKHVIYLPQKDEEKNYKIELLISKEISVGCNQVSFSAELEDQTNFNFDYNYFVINNVSQLIETLQSCVTINLKTHETNNYSLSKKVVYAQLNGGSFLNYNSAVPIVIYAPKDLKVQYKIWNTNSDIRNSQIL